MKFTQTPPENVLNGAVALLQPYMETLSPTALVRALKAYEEGNPTSDLPEFLTKHEAGKVLNAHADTVARWCRSGILKGVKIGQRWKIPAEEIRRLAEEGGLYG